MFKAILLVVSISVLAVLAQIEPQEPAPGNVYNEGAACNIQWAKDTTGQWTTMNIELMTGSNNAMTHLTTIATLDGTKVTSYSFNCPAVTPNSAIYFYQFSTPVAPANLTWTGRFTIADASGKTTDPTDEEGGVKFGNGVLDDAGSATPAPSYLNQDQDAVSASVTGTVTSSGSTVPTTTVQTVASTSVTGALTATGSLTTRSVSAASRTAANQATGSGSDSNADASASPSSSANGASALSADFRTRGMQALVGLGCTALIFSTVF